MSDKDKIETHEASLRPDGKTDNYFGRPGEKSSDGRPHGHAVANDKGDISYWREPKSEGGEVLKDDSKGIDKL